MASLGKMSIRGIRAFSPDREETIEFYSPLTMIVGANGCGKTTIIECLKYSCTGSLPPGTRSGQSFINDPSMTDTAEVKANIKLRFTNRQGHPTVVVRSFQLTKKRTKMEFKALDGVVRMTDDRTGEKVSLTQKCSELDKHVPDLLGVSKAIMENVVFCHQEESNWPLQEGALLKKKFDDIFESTRYSKALDAISKSKKEFVMRCKDLQKDVAELSAYLHSANDMRESLELNQQKVSECAEELDAVELSIERTGEKLGLAKAEVDKFQSMQLELQQLELKVDELTRRAEEKKNSLEKEFSESDDELNNMHRNFDDEMTSLTREFREIEKMIEISYADISSLRRHQDALNRQHGEIVLLEKQFQDQITTTFESMKEFSRTYTLTAVPTAAFREGTGWDSSASDRFLKASRSHISNLVDDLNKTLDVSRDQVRASESALMASKSALQTVKLAVGEKNRELNRIESDRANVKREISAGGTGGRASVRGRKAEAEADYNRCNDDLIAYQETATAKINQIKGRIAESVDRIRELDGLIASDDSALRELSLRRAELERLNAVERQCTADNDACVIEGSSILSTYTKAGDPSPDAPVNLTSAADVSNLSAILASQARSLKDRLAVMTASLESSKRKVYQLSATLEADEKRQCELQDKMLASNAVTRALNLSLERLNRIRRDEKYHIAGEEYKDLTADDPILAIEDALRDVDDDLQNRKVFMESSKLWRGKFIKKATKSRGSSSNSSFVCPCCDRGMNDSEKANFDNKVNELFKFNEVDNGVVMRQYDEFKVLQKEILELLQKMRPFAEHRCELQAIETRLVSQRDLLENARSEELKVLNDINPVEKRYEIIKQVSLTVSSLLSRWTDVVQRMEDYNSRKQRHGNTQSLGAYTDNRSYQQIEDDRSSRGTERDNLQRKKDSLVEEENRISKQFQSLKLMLSEAEKTLMSARASEKRQDELEARLNEFSSREEAILEEIAKLKRDIVDAERAVTSSEAVLKGDKEKLGKEEAHVQSRTLSLRGELDVLVRTIIATDDQSRKMATKTPSLQVKKDLDTVLQDNSAKEELLKEYQPKMAAINTQINHQEQVKKVVQDNIVYRSTCVELEYKKAELSEIRSKALSMGNVQSTGGDSAAKYLSDKKREVQRAEQEYQRLLDTRAKLSGRLSTLKEQTDEYELKLDSPQFRSIDERFRRKNIEYETTQMACSDLDAYFNALDRALLNFHTLKIKEVNKIIKELWQLIYRGEDIDNIEIVSGIEAAEGGAPVGGRSDKSFNYRVVMKKGDSPMEMRGRCSAGQRVLACIVIRLALAETFCLNCGILALDEPTTNLDELNKAGLAHALARIISNRARQHNFQLVCITHDEDFVRIMNMELAALSSFSLPEHYFRISRIDNAHTGKFFSHIERIPWGDM